MGNGKGSSILQLIQKDFVFDFLQLAPRCRTSAPQPNGAYSVEECDCSNYYTECGCNAFGIVTTTRAPLVTVSTDDAKKAFQAAAAPAPSAKGTTPASCKAVQVQYSTYYILLAHFVKHETTCRLLLLDRVMEYTPTLAIWGQITPPTVSVGIT